MNVLLLLLLMTVSNAFAGEVIRLDGISIQGNSEEPNVLYITPWQPAPGAGRLYAPVNSYREQWLKPISRQTMKREVKYLDYYQNLNTASDDASDSENK